MITQRILAILSAVLLVGAVATAMLGSPGMSLGQLLYTLDYEMVEATRRFTSTHLATWLWDWLVVPLMLRPAWLMPAALGLLFGGLALSLSTRKSAQESHRRSSR